MAASRPVIAPREGGPCEIVVDGKTGVLVPPRDPDVLAAAMVALLEDPQRRPAMARAARGRVAGAVDHRGRAAARGGGVGEVGRRPGAGMSRRKVLVLGKSDSSFLTVIRSLGRQGIEVHIAWCPTIEVARRSRYVHAVHELPPFRPGDDAWKWAFLDLCERERFDLVIPTNDPTIIPLQEHRADLEPDARIYLRSDRAYRGGYDKQRSYEVCREIGVPVPPPLILPVPAEPADVLREFSLPVVVKARSSFRSEDLGDRR